jgi:hypothetical protein
MHQSHPEQTRQPVLVVSHERITTIDCELGWTRNRKGCSISGSSGTSMPLITLPYCARLEKVCALKLVAVIAIVVVLQPEAAP